MAELELEVIEPSGVLYQKGPTGTWHGECEVSICRMYYRHPTYTDMRWTRFTMTLEHLIKTAQWMLSIPAELEVSSGL